MNTKEYYQQMQEAQQQGRQQDALRIAEEAAAAKTSVKVIELQGQVVLAFGERVESIGMTPQLARDLATQMCRIANEIDEPRLKPGRRRHKPKHAS